MRQPNGRPKSWPQLLRLPIAGSRWDGTPVMPRFNRILRCPQCKAIVNMLPCPAWDDQRLVWDWSTDIGEILVCLDCAAPLQEVLR
jgi:hypothetical protein